MTTSADAMLGGLPCFTRRESVQLTHGGGPVVQHAASGRTVGQRAMARPISISADLYPKKAIDATRLPDLLNMQGVLPLYLPNGDAYAVEAAGHQVSGWYDLAGDAYATRWRVNQQVVLADLFWFADGDTPGHGIYPKGLTYGVHGTYFHDPATRSWVFDEAGGTWMNAAPSDATTYPQRQLVAAVTPRSVGGTVSISLGLAVYAATPGSGAFGSSGLGVVFTDDRINIVGVNEVADPVMIVPIDVPWLVVVTARPGGGRVELWAGTHRVAVRTNVPCNARVDGYAPILNVRSGAARISHWWVQNV